MGMSMEPLHELFGVCIEHIDVTRLDDTDFALVKRAIHEHGFALFREQHLDPDSAVALARRLGDPLPGYRPQFTHPDYPELVQLGNKVRGSNVVTYLNTQGIEWHSDGTGAVLPPNVTMLYAVEAPCEGGDTLFASATASYVSLPPETKARLDGLEVVNSFDHHNDQASGFDGANFKPRDESLRSRNPDKVEALVQKHPVTGEDHFFITHQMVKEVVGMDRVQGMDLVMGLVDHITQPCYVYRHHWLAGDLIVFDNRSTLHSATAYDYPNESRLMYQIIIGERLTTHGQTAPASAL